MTEPTQAQTIRINGILHRVMRSMMGQEYFVPIAEDQVSEPTQAQIDAVAVLRDVRAEVDLRKAPKLAARIDAALTAAAEVGVNDLTSKVMNWHDEVGSKIAAATIERCAQVAETFQLNVEGANHVPAFRDKIAAAIRALKDKP